MITLCSDRPAIRKTPKPRNKNQENPSQVLTRFAEQLGGSNQENLCQENLSETPNRNDDDVSTVSLLMSLTYPINQPGEPRHSATT